MHETDHERGEPFRISGNLVDPIARRVRPATLAVTHGRITDITWDASAHATWLLPGFVDAHVHVESSLLPPHEFARLAVAHGTVATVSDPHEIANVLGIPGVDFMLDDAADSPFTFHFGAPSCVPATRFDRSGATIAADGVAALLDRPAIGSLAEVMNYPGVVARDPEVLAKIAAATARSKPVDGHAPGLRGAPLEAYVAAGITTDHECVTLVEAREKVALGMKILIREGSAARNFDALAPLIDERPDMCMLCSDDLHPDRLAVGHVDVLVRRALARGSGLFDVLQAACVNPVRHYALPVGLLQPGDRADFLEVDDLERMRVRRVFVSGRLAADDGVPTWPRRPSAKPNRFEATPKTPDDFRIRLPEAEGRRVRVIEARDGQLVTGCVTVPARVEEGYVVADPEADVLSIALVDRYDDRPPAVALVRSFGLRDGAIASSVSHDSHNVVAVGTNPRALARAVNLVIAARGGLAAVGPTGERVLPLEIAGLMSDRPGPEVAAAYTAIDAFAKGLGSRLAAPFMTLSFMALLVIPALKLGPMGLFDVERFAPVGLIAD